LVALALLLALGVTSAAGAEPDAPLGHSGRWITDAQGRVVILHGVNMVFKRPPYYPAAGGFDDDDAAFLEQNGFNTVRLGLIYAGVEPAPGSYDEAYLDQIGSTESLLAQHGIFSLLDFHQDLYNERFQGEGWPDWAVQDDGLPAIPPAGFPANYLLMLALNRAFDHFWANDPGPGGVGLQDRYAAALAHVAARFDSEGHTLGYDLLNEPWPGTVYPTCLVPLIGCPLFDGGTLAPFNARMIDAIRGTGAGKLVWYEPLVTFDFGVPTNLPATGDPGTAMSFHDYCLPGSFGLPADVPCSLLEDLVFQNAEAHSQATGDPQLLTEFGATDDLTTIERIIDDADRHMVGWQYWHYCGCDDPTTSGPTQQAIVNDASVPPTGDNVRQAKLEVLSRPYPQTVAGTPSEYGFDPASGVFHLSFSTTGPDGRQFDPGAITEVFVGTQHYPAGYDVAVSGAEIKSAEDASTLLLAGCPGADRVTVTVSPAAGAGDQGADCLAESGGGAGDGSGAAPGASGAAGAFGAARRCGSLRAKLKRARKPARKRQLRARLRKLGC
jgi:endoglycosylceramidase